MNWDTWLPSHKYTKNVSFLPSVISIFWKYTSQSDFFVYDVKSSQHFGAIVLKTGVWSVPSRTMPTSSEYSQLEKWGSMIREQFWCKLVVEVMVDQLLVANQKWLSLGQIGQIVIQVGTTKYSDRRYVYGLLHYVTLIKIFGSKLDLACTYYDWFRCSPAPPKYNY